MNEGSDVSAQDLGRGTGMWLFLAEWHDAHRCVAAIPCRSALQWPCGTFDVIAGDRAVPTSYCLFEGPKAGVTLMGESPA